MFSESSIVDIFRNSVVRNPRKTAIVDKDYRLTYRNVWGAASKLSHALSSRGLRKGDRVAICLGNSWELIVSIVAVSQLGGVFVNVSPQLPEKQLSHILDDCGARVFIGKLSTSDVKARPLVETAVAVNSPPPTKISWAADVLSFQDTLQTSEQAAPIVSVSGSDLATIMYTSGSTGAAKGVMLTHRNLVEGVQVLSDYLGMTSKDRALCLLQASFIYGLSDILNVVRVGGTLVFQHSLLPGDLLVGLRRQRITGLAGVPFIWTLLLKSRRSIRRKPLSRLRYITNSGGAITPRDFRELVDLFPHTRIFLMYGLTEGRPATCLDPDELRRGPTCIGLPLPNREMWVVREDGSEACSDEVGELVQMGPHVAIGYWGDEDQTRATFRPAPCFDNTSCRRVLYTGDLVRQDRDGYLYFVGRRDERIKSRGYRISPETVEGLLLSMEGVDEAVVFGRPDSIAGQRIAALVSLSKHMSQAEIVAECSRIAPGYMIPRQVLAVDRIPRSSSGKPDRSAAREIFERVLGADETIAE